MRRFLIIVTLLAMPSLAFAQTPQPTNKETVLLQLIEDMKQVRAVIHPSEIEAAGCKVEVRQLREQIEQAKKTSDKKAPVQAGETQAGE